jgi:hypothetical protein
MLPGLFLKRLMRKMKNILRWGLQAMLLGLVFGSPVLPAEEPIIDEVGSTVDTSIDFEIIPGTGIGEVVLGEPLSRIVAVLGPVEKRTEYAKEITMYTEFGRNIKLISEFYLQFDYSVEYSRHTNKSRYPVFKVFFKDGKAVQITLSIFPYEEAHIKQPYISPDLHFNATKEQMESVLGKDYVFHEDKFGYGIYQYLSKGVTFMIKKGGITTIKIYKPFGERAKAEYTNQIKEQTAGR